MEELQKLSNEMAELLRQKNAQGFSGQIVTKEGIVVNRSLSINESTSMTVDTNTLENTTTSADAPSESGVSNVTSTSSSYVVKSIPRTGGHW